MINNSFSYGRHKDDSDIDVNINEHLSSSQLLRKSTKPFGSLTIENKTITLSMKRCNEILDDCASAWSKLNLKKVENVDIEIDGYTFKMNAERIELLADTLQRTKDVAFKKYRFN